MVQFFIYVVSEPNRASHLLPEKRAVTGTHSGQMAAQSVDRHGEMFGRFLLSRKPGSAGNKRLEFLEYFRPSIRP